MMETLNQIIQICIYVHVYIHVHVHVHAFTNTCAQVHVYACIMYRCTILYMCIYIVHVHVYMYILYECTHVHTCTIIWMSSEKLSIVRLCRRRCQTGSTPSTGARASSLRENSIHAVIHTHHSEHYNTSHCTYNKHMHKHTHTPHHLCTHTHDNRRVAITHHYVKQRSKSIPRVKRSLEDSAKFQLTRCLRLIIQLCAKTNHFSMSRRNQSVCKPDHL